MIKFLEKIPKNVFFFGHVGLHPIGLFRICFLLPFYLATQHGAVPF
jgi:hypothetical protein